MIAATEGEPAREFTIPTGIRFELVNPITGLPETDPAHHSEKVALREGQIPSGKVLETDSEGTP